MLLAGKQGLVFSVTNNKSIGWAIARAAAEHGAKVGVGAQNEGMRRRVEKLVEGDDRFGIIELDFQDEAAMAGLSDVIKSAYPDGIDFLVHSAAYAQREDLEGRFLDTSREGFQLALDISAYSLVALCRALESNLNDDASVMCLSYLGSTRAAGNYNVMGVAKAALEASARYLAADLGGRGIRVNTISPGPINTVSARGVKDLLTMIDHVKERAPLKRPAEQDEVAGAAVYLMSDLSRGVTGQVLFVDAGYNIVAL